MSRRFCVVLLLTGGLFLIGGCEPDGSKFLINARDFLGVDEKTFQKHLTEQFIVTTVSGRRFLSSHFRSYPDVAFYLQGQDIHIAYQVTDYVNFPDVMAVNRIRKEHNIKGVTVESATGDATRKREDLRVSMIQLLFPYKVSKATAAKMLGYRLGLGGKYSDDGFWRDSKTGHTITVINNNSTINLREQTLVMVSVAAEQRTP